MRREFENVLHKKQYKTKNSKDKAWKPIYEETYQALLNFCTKNSITIPLCCSEKPKVDDRLFGDLLLVSYKIIIGSY